MSHPPAPPVDDETILGYTDSGEPMILKHHSANVCVPPCAFHTPSDHPLKDAPLNWRSGLSPYDGRRLLERFCTHGIAHPDPDGLDFANDNLADGAEPDTGVHGCDGCCHGRPFHTQEQPASDKDDDDFDTGVTILGKRDLTPEDLAVLNCTPEHKILSYNFYTGYDIRDLHPSEDCNNEMRLVHYFARALLSPPDGVLGADNLVSKFLLANRTIPLVTTCDLLHMEVVVDDECWEPNDHDDETVGRLNERGLDRLALILNDYTASMRNSAL